MVRDPFEFYDFSELVAGSHTLKSATAVKNATRKSQVLTKFLQEGHPLEYGECPPLWKPPCKFKIAPKSPKDISDNSDLWTQTL